MERVSALIFDLRDNIGGTSEMVSLIASYLFDHPEYMFDPRRVPTPQSWTSSPVPGSNLTNTPVYILTSATTISGGLERLDHDRIGDDHLQYFVGRAEETSAQSSYPLKSENAIHPAISTNTCPYSCLRLYLVLARKGRGDEDGERCHGCHNDGKAARSCFYLLSLLFLRH